MTVPLVPLTAAASALGVVVGHSFPLQGRRVARDGLLHFPHFGAAAGMVLAAEARLLTPLIAPLRQAGYGYSCFDFRDGVSTEGLREVLCDWGWSGDPAHRPAWLAPA